MRIKTIAKKIWELLDSEKTKKKNKVKALERLIKKLEIKEKKLRNEINDSKSDKEIKKLKTKLKLCREHHKKGVKALKDMAKI
jgi:predicted  nucleic acid-binding Zn-ribbon protein